MPTLSVAPRICGALLFFTNRYDRATFAEDLSQKESIDLLSTGVEMLMREYRTKDNDDLIGILLDRLSQKSALEQLMSQKILSIEVRLSGQNLAALLMPTDTGFSIWLAQTRCPRWTEDIGHELAHTFFHDLSGNKPRLRVARDFGPIDKAEEDFCEAFCLRWDEIYQDECNTLLKPLMSGTDRTLVL